MFLPNAINVRGLEDATPPACKPFSIHSNVCVGNLVVIIVCGAAGLGFVCWAIHAVRKMRRGFPFNYKPEEEKASNKDRVPSSFDNSPLVRSGVIQTPIPPTHMQTRSTLYQPEEHLYRLSTPSYVTAQGSITRTARFPSQAGRRPERFPAHGPDHSRVPSLQSGSYDRYSSVSRPPSVYRSGNGYVLHGDELGPRNVGVRTRVSGSGMRRPFEGGNML